MAFWGVHPINIGVELHPKVYTTIIIIIIILIASFLFLVPFQNLSSEHSLQKWLFV